MVQLAQLSTQVSHFHMYITVSFTKSSHQDRCPCYLDLPIFLLYIQSPLLLENIKLLCLLFSSASQTTYHFAVIYYVRLFYRKDWFQYHQQTQHTAYSIHHLSWLFYSELICLNFKMGKFTLQLNQSYQRSQFFETMSSRLQMLIQNPVKHLRWNVLAVDYFRKFLQSYMFDRVLNMPVDYLSSFVLVIRGIHVKVVVCQTDYSIHFKLRTFLYSEVIWKVQHSR